MTITKEKAYGDIFQTFPRPRRIGTDQEKQAHMFFSRVLANDHKRPVLHVSYHPIDKLLATGRYQVAISRRDYVIYQKV